MKNTLLCSFLVFSGTLAACATSTTRGVETTMAKVLISTE